MRGISGASVRAAAATQPRRGGRNATPLPGAAATHHHPRTHAGPQQHTHIPSLAIHVVVVVVVLLSSLPFATVLVSPSFAPSSHSPHRPLTKLRPCRRRAAAAAYQRPAASTFIKALIGPCSLVLLDLLRGKSPRPLHSFLLLCPSSPVTPLRTHPFRSLRNWPFPASGRTSSTAASPPFPLGHAPRIKSPEGSSGLQVSAGRRFFAPSPGQQQYSRWTGSGEWGRSAHRRSRWEGSR